jgi:hypothetical protein
LRYRISIFLPLFFTAKTENELTFSTKLSQMNILITILLVVVGIIALLLIIAFFIKKEHSVNREIIINAPRQKVFDFLKLLKNRDLFNKWATADKKNRKEEFKGTDGTVEFIYSWSGDKSAGQGEKEIKNIIEGKRIETEIRFVKPMRVSASVIFETESLSDDQTKVNLINTGTLKYPLNIMIPMAEKKFPKDMDDSLSTLKNILEK